MFRDDQTCTKIHYANLHYRSILRRARSTYIRILRKRKCHVDGRGHVTAATENKMADSSTDSDDDKLDVDQIVTPEGGKL